MNASKWLVGIDYSMTCPGLTIFDTSLPFTFNNCNLYYLSEKPAKQLLPNVTGARLGEYKSNEERFDLISEWAMDCILETTKHADPPDVSIFIEDYSFGSIGRTFHIAENEGLIKHKCFKVGYSITAVPPTVIKKFATGKGNATKDQIYAAFVQETRVELMPLFQPKAHTVGSPVGDIIDSFYICKYGTSFLTS